MGHEYSCPIGLSIYYLKRLSRFEQRNRYLIGSTLESYFYSHSDGNVLGITFHYISEHTNSFIQFDKSQHVGAGIKALGPILVGNRIGPDRTAAR